MAEACVITYYDNREMYEITYKGKNKRWTYSNEHAQVIAVYTQIHEVLWSRILSLGLNTDSCEVRACREEYERAFRKINEFIQKDAEEHYKRKKAMEEARASL